MFKIVITLLLISNFGIAQNVSVTYRVKDTLGNQQLFKLDILENTSWFYSQEYCDNSGNEIINGEAVYKTTANQTYEVADRIEDADIRFELNPKLQWKLKNEKMRVDGVELQKAEVLYNKMLWTAWYNPDQPIVDGPFIFSGLPGLIYKIESESLVIDVLSIQKNVNKCISFPVKFKRITSEEYVTYKNNLKEETVAAFKNHTSSVDNFLMKEFLNSFADKDFFMKYFLSKN